MGSNKKSRARNAFENFVCLNIHPIYKENNDNKNYSNNNNKNSNHKIIMTMKMLIAMMMMIIYNDNVCNDYGNSG